MEKVDKVSKNIYDLTNKILDSEKFGLVSQIGRAFVLVLSNIAEGFARSSYKKFIQFLYITLDL